MAEKEIANSVVQQLKDILIKDQKMWSVADIAEFMGMSTSTIRNRVITHSDFPVPIRIPYDKNSRTDHRWYPEEVKKWISKHRSKH